MEPFKELCNRNEASPLQGPSQQDSMESERQLNELRPPLVLLELFHSPEKTENPLTSFCDKNTFSNRMQ